MSHAAHFLTRLERLKAPEVELALALYRDPRIVKELISSLALENNSDRVALAMTEDAKGPWLIVSADGGFVTCLGRGMRLKNKHVVSRARVDEALREKKRSVLGERLLSKQPGLVSLLAQRAVISREEFTAIAAYHQVLDQLSVAWLVEGSLETCWLQARCEAERQPMQTLERYWRDVQKHGHHASLLGLSASNPDGLDDQSAAALVDVIQLKVWSHGSLSACARALWASAHWHLPRFDAVTKAVLEPLPSPHRVGRLVEIAVLGLAHAPLFEKARRFLSGNAEVFEALSQAGSPRLQALFAEVFAHPLASIRRVEAEGLAAMARARIHGGSRFEALQFALLQPVNVFARGQRSLETLIRALPFIAHCKAEELYLPEVVLNASGLRQVDRQTIEANVEAARLTSAHTPALREDRRGRNELCGCGSGKKHKRCCLVTV